MNQFQATAEVLYMLAFGAEVRLAMPSEHGVATVSAHVCCLLDHGRFAVQLDQPELLPTHFVGQTLSIDYSNRGDAQYSGETSIYSINLKTNTLILTEPRTVGRRQNRTFVRVAYPVLVRVIAFDDDDGVFWSGSARVRDVSAGGLCLTLPIELPITARLNCRFELRGRNGAVSVDTMARVVRNCVGTYGVQFTGITDSLEQQLVAAVSFLQLSTRVCA
jgi:hypothetical protein